MSAFIYGAYMVLMSWRERHPLKHHCEPLRADLHTSIPPSKIWDDTLF